MFARIQTDQMTAAQFWEYAALRENAHRRLELEDGMVIEMAPSRPINTTVAGRIIHFLNAYIIPNDLGYVSVPDGGYRLGEGRVRQPDAAYISKARLPELPDHFDLAPDLAVEVASPGEEVLKKVKEYLAAGTRLVWVIYTDERSIEVFRSEEPRWRTLTDADTLDGESVLPGFTLAVAEVFPAD